VRLREAFWSLVWFLDREHGSAGGCGTLLAAVVVTLAVVAVMLLGRVVLAGWVR
jgi:hypothetical protein